MSATDVVRSLLALRAWSIGVLSRAPRRVSEIAGLDASVWRLFVSLERCAIPLLERIPVAELAQLDESARSVLREFAARDMQTVMEARHVAAEVDAVARVIDRPIVVLKGGVRTITGDPPILPVVDLDILARFTDLGAVSQALISHGFGSPREEAVTSTAHHVTFPASGSRLAVELHWSLNIDGIPASDELWSSAEPIGYGTDLRRLSAKHQLEHLLDHALWQHVDQSVTLRDSLLIGAVAEECPPGERDATVHKVSRGKLDLSRDLVEFCRRLHSADATIAVDPMRESAAIWYAAVAVSRRLPRRVRSDSLLKYISMYALKRSGKIETARHAARYRGTSSVVLRSVHRGAPRLGAAITGALHLAWYGAIGAFVYPVVVLTARRASQRTQ